MLLSVRPFVDASLECWLAGGKRYVVDPPTLPYFYSRKPRMRRFEAVKRLLSKPDEEITMFKVLVQ